MIFFLLQDDISFHITNISMKLSPWLHPPHATPGVHRSGENAEAIGVVTARAQAVHQAVKIRQAALP